MKVSCIMPTRGRPVMAQEAVGMFLAQMYPDKELIVVDDELDPSFTDLVAPGVVYMKAPNRLSVGEKRNLACQHATGKVICHWDSDDIYAPDRVAHQLQQLLASGMDLVGYNEMLFQEVDGRHFQYKGSEHYVIGVSMMYWKDVWKRRGFVHRDENEDNDFLAGRKFQGYPSESRIIARVHDGNTCNKRLAISRNPAQWVLV